MYVLNGKKHNTVIHQCLRGIGSKTCHSFSSDAQVPWSALRVGFNTSKLWTWYVIHPQQVESMDAEPANMEGQLYIYWKKSML